MAFLVGLHVPQHDLLEGGQLVGLRRAFGLAVGVKGAPDGVGLKFPQRHRHRAAHPLGSGLSWGHSSDLSAACTFLMSDWLPGTSIRLRVVFSMVSSGPSSKSVGSRPSTSPTGHLPMSHCFFSPVAVGQLRQASNCAVNISGSILPAEPMATICVRGTRPFHSSPKATSDRRPTTCKIARRSGFSAA